MYSLFCKHPPACCVYLHLAVQIGLKGTTQNRSIHCIQHHQAFMGECQIVFPKPAQHKCDSVSTQIKAHLSLIPMQATVIT